MSLSSLTSRHWLLAMAGLCIAGVAAALVAQYGFDMQPCPYCILQRLIFVVIAIACMVGAWVPTGGRKLLGALGGLLALAAAAAAMYQHFVAAKSASCNLTLADKIINALTIEALSPALFTVRGSCADAAVSVFGVPFEFWSLGLALVLAVMALRVVRS